VRGNGFLVVCGTAQGTGTFSINVGNLRTSTVGSTVGAVLIDNSSATIGQPISITGFISSSEAEAFVVLDLTPSVSGVPGGPLVQGVVSGEYTPGSVGLTQLASFESQITVGNLLVVGVSSINNFSTFTISDTLGNTWNTASGPVSSNGTMYIFYAKVTFGGWTTIVVVNGGTGGEFRILAHEYTGYGALDQVGHNSSASGSSLTSGSMTTQAPGELIFTLASIQVTTTFTAGGSATSRVTFPNAAFQHYCVWSEDQVVTTKGTYTPSGTTGAGGAWQMSSATFIAIVPPPSSQKIGRESCRERV